MHPLDACNTRPLAALDHQYDKGAVKSRTPHLLNRYSDAGSGHPPASSEDNECLGIVVALAPTSLLSNYLKP
jgi:hypothetical protein